MNLFSQDDTLFTNNRPIPLLPAISKAYEKNIFKQLYHFFLDRKLLYNAQYLLFIICINNIAQAIELFDFIINADDTTLSTTLEIVIRNTQNLLIIYLTLN